MDKNNRKEIYKKTLELINNVNTADLECTKLGINLEFDNDKTVIGRLMNILFTSPKEIIYDTLKLKLLNKECYSEDFLPYTMYIVYPESENVDFSCLDEDMFHMLDIAAENEEFADKLWDCFVEEDCDAKNWIEEYMDDQIFPEVIKSEA